jgi:hypothetical protein
VGSRGIVVDDRGVGCDRGNTEEGVTPSKSAVGILSGMELAESLGGALENGVSGCKTNKVSLAVAVGGEPAAIDGSHVGRVKSLDN